MLEVLARNRWWLLVRGVAAVVVGILAFVLPNITLLALVLLFGAYALVDGVAALVLALRGRHPEGAKTWMLVAVGIAGIAAGVVTFFWPGITAVALLAVVAAWAIARGIFEIIAAFRLRREIDREWLLGLSGAVSIAFGVILILQPSIGLLALVWLVGVYAVVVGILEIVLSFRLPQLERRFGHASHA